jgi:hypothetical protein
MSVTAAISRCLAIVLVLITSVAHAQTPTPADAAFKRGRELLKAGKYADACIEFEHSQKLDPALGTEFNIAQCSEKVGKLARALELYRGMLPRDQNADRKKIVGDAIPKLEARVPHLLVKVPAPPPGLTVTIQVINSGNAPKALETNKPIEIDFGEYSIVAKASGVPDWSQNVRIDTEGKTTTVEPPFGKPTTTGPTTGPTTTGPTVTGAVQSEQPEPEDDPAPPKSKRKLIGIVAMAGGGAALITGLVFGKMASNKWSDAKDVCGGTTCTTTADQMKAQDLGDSARSKATLSTIFVGFGIAAAATGVVLFMTAPSTESQTAVSAHPTQDGAGITLSGRF